MDSHKVRQFALLVAIGPQLSWIQTSAELAELLTDAKEAIGIAKKIQGDLWRCEILAAKLEQQHSEELLSLLEIVRTLICQSDVPASWYMQDGQPDDALQVVVDSLLRVHCDARFLLLEQVGKCHAKAQRISNDGIDLVEFEKSCGCSTNTFFGFSNVELKEHIDTWQCDKADAEKPIVKTKEIPTDHRSKPISKKKAAKFLGKTGDEGRAVEWLNGCISDGTIACVEMSRQSFCFDMRQFPSTKHPLMKP